MIRVGNSLGEIVPFRGRWNWPFAEMEEGEYFVVDQQRRAKGAVANLAYVRGSKLGRRFSVTDDPELVGFTRVTCSVEDVTQMEPTAHPKLVLELKWKEFEKLMKQHGGEIDQQFIGITQHSWPVSWSQQPRMEKVILDIHGGPYEVTFHKDRVDAIVQSLVASSPAVVVDKHDLLAD